MEIYIVLEIDVNTENDADYNEIYVFNDIEEANKKVRELKEDFIKDVNINDFVVEDYTDEEESLCSFCAYEDGNYNNNHYSAVVFQREIEE